MPLDPRLLEILACPDDKRPLYYFPAEAFLFCPACRRRYEVRDDIPVMLIDEATVLPEAEAEALVERARAEEIEPTFISGDTPGPPGISGDTPGPPGISGDTPGPPGISGDAPGPPGNP